MTSQNTQLMNNHIIYKSISNMPQFLSMISEKVCTSIKIFTNNMILTRFHKIYFFNIKYNEIYKEKIYSITIKLNTR